MEHPINVYITAHTLISSLGFGTPEHTEAIRQGASGIRWQEDGRISDSPMWAGVIDSDRLQARAEQEHLQDYTRLEQLFILSIEDILARSGADLRRPDCALLLSTTKGNIDRLGESPVYLWDMAGRIGGFFHAACPVEVISNACISGVSALIVGKRWIETGRYRQVIVAGGDVLSHFITSGFRSFKSLSGQRCRPYDSHRDGLSLGEACGAVLLTAQETPGSICLSGGAITNDANHISGPSRTGDGLALAIRQAMEEAGTAATDISFVNAHGTATVYNDEMESKAIHLAGLEAVPVNSLKPYIGHTLGASGVVETVLCIEQLKQGICYGTLGYETLGVPLPIRVSADHQPLPMKHCVKTASGFGGCNAAIVLSLPEARQGQVPAPFRPADVRRGKTVRIGQGKVELDGTVLLRSSATDFAAFIREAYKQLGESNLKFYKMDNLCKLGYVAAGHLLKDAAYRPEEVGILLANASSSLDTDNKHQALISQGGDAAASPAVFVYTLPNVVLGEICIRHKIQGENTFFVRPHYDAAFLEDYARIVMAKTRLRTCIIGWCELSGEQYQAEFTQLLMKELRS